jgi:hypothetical protein
MVGSATLVQSERRSVTQRRVPGFMITTAYDPKRKSGKSAYGIDGECQLTASRKLAALMANSTPWKKPY